MTPGQILPVPFGCLLTGPRLPPVRAPYDPGGEALVVNGGRRRAAGRRSGPELRLAPEAVADVGGAVSVARVGRKTGRPGRVGGVGGALRRGVPVSAGLVSSEWGHGRRRP